MNRKNTSLSCKTPLGFSLEMFLTGMIPNIIAASIIFFFLFHITGLMETEFTKIQILEFSITSLCIVTICEFCIAPFTNYFLTNSVSKSLYNFYTHETTNEERTELLKKIIRLPRKISIQVALVFFFAFVIELYILTVYYNIRSSLFIFIFIASIECVYNASAFADAYAESLCSKKAFDISAKGLDSHRILRDKFYGKKISSRIAYYIVLSFILSSTTHLAFFIIGTVDRIPTQMFFSKMGLLLIVNSITTIANGLFISSEISRSFSKINSILTNYTDATMEKQINLPVDLSNEIAYNFYLINGIADYITSISNDTLKNSKVILGTIENLTSISKNYAEASQSESVFVKNSLNQMKNATLLLNQISEKITEVRNTSESTKQVVNDGSSILKANILKMSEISDANLDTISGIKNLSEKIEAVWEYITKIDTIAEKTRIIAFNAEIEASYAGEHGEKFHIVANEIRRLASTITDFIREIKERIQAIQYSSDNLIITSEAGTQKIHEGLDFFVNLEEQFSDVRMSSDITAESATQIQTTTEGQTSLFKEIELSLNDIATDFDYFTQSAGKLSETAQEINTVSDLLKSIKTQEADK